MHSLPLGVLPLREEEGSLVGGSGGAVACSVGPLPASTLSGWPRRVNVQDHKAIRGRVRLQYFNISQLLSFNLKIQ